MQQKPNRIQAFAKWLLAGGSGGVGIYFALNHQWPQAIVSFSATGFISLWSIFKKVWASFTQDATEELEESANRPGKHTAKLQMKKIDNLHAKLLWLLSRFRGLYLKSIRDAYRDLKLERFRIGLPGIDLEHAFVPLQLVTGIPGQMSGAMVQTLDNTEFQEIGDVWKFFSQNGQIPNTEAQEIWQFLRQIDKIPDYRRIAILAPPGYGKTTLLQYLTLIYARRAHRKRKVPDLIPVLIDLHNIRQPLTQENPPTLAAFMKAQMAAQLSEALTPPPHWFENQLKAGRCLVLLDGLDDVADEGERHQVSRWVNQQIHCYRQSQTTFILTSRPHGYPSHLLDQIGLVLTVKPFDLTQIKLFIHTWSLQLEKLTDPGGNDPGVIQQAIQQTRDNAETLTDAIIRKPAIRQMASNPLLLTAIATVRYCGDALPERRVELYQKICDVLLGAIQSAQRIEMPLTPEQNQSVLQALALKLMLQELRSFTLEEGKALIQDSLQAVSNTLSPEAFLSQIKEVSGLLVEKQTGIYEFAHLSLQAYLAATQIKQLQQEDILTRNFQHLWWAETIRLYAAQSDATPLIQTALTLPQQTLPSLSLAYDCLAESWQVNPAVRKQLENRLEAGLESDEPERARMAAAVKLSRRLSRLREIDDWTAIDRGYITRSEYRLASPETSRSSAQAAVTDISFADAVKFCNWLTVNAPKLQQSPESGAGKVFCYRLPGAAELQYPAREYPDLTSWSNDDSKPDSGIRIVREQAQVPERYLPLWQYLAAGQWQLADEETYKVMCKATGKQGWDWQVENVQNFPCDDLRILDQLWVQFSGGHFGFSVQRDIWVAMGGTLDGNLDQTWTYWKFCDRVQWLGRLGKHLDWENLTFNLSSAPGHLPTVWGGLRHSWLLLCPRIAHCKV